MSKTIEIIIPYIEGRKKKEKTFEISITPNRFNVDYGEYTKYLSKVLDVENKVKAATTVDALNAITAEMEGMDLTSLLEMKYGLIKTMMVANGYEFDRDFWDLKVDPNDVNDFINQSALKDQTDDNKKKVAEMLRSIMTV